MLLHNLHLVDSDDGAKTVRVLDGIIRSVEGMRPSSAGEAQEPALFFENAIAFPGLINSHDHLDFNLFPLLGNRQYNNYVEWGEDIHLQNEETISNVLKVPQPLRMQWGIYKNLLNGVTTVISHGKPLAVENTLGTVFQQCQSLHSLQLERRWRYKINRPFNKGFPVVIHIGEGTDGLAQQEIDRLIRWNLFKRKLIGIHGVAMNERQAAFFKALVWCPASNYFLLGKTASVNLLKHHTEILFGTDSTLTGPWNMWEHLRLARNTKMVSNEELFGMLTTVPASAWRLERCGKIAENCRADIVIARRKENFPWDSFFAVNPPDILLLLHKGNILLFDSELSDQLATAGIVWEHFSKIEMKGYTKYVLGNLPGLMEEIRKYYPSAAPVF